MAANLKIAVSLAAIIFAMACTDHSLRLPYSDEVDEKPSKVHSQSGPPYVVRTYTTTEVRYGLYSMCYISRGAEDPRVWKKCSLLPGQGENGENIGVRIKELELENYNGAAWGTVDDIEVEITDYDWGEGIQDTPRFFSQGKFLRLLQSKPIALENVSIPLDVYWRGDSESNAPLDALQEFSVDGSTISFAGKALICEQDPDCMQLIQNVNKVRLGMLEKCHFSLNLMLRSDVNRSLILRSAAYRDCEAL